MEENILRDLGLSRREARTYLALLEIGSTTVGKVIKKTEIPGTKIYEVLGRLIEKGLVSYVVIKHKKHFQAAEPEAILNSFEERKSKFEKILPVLKKRASFAEEKRDVETYLGKTAVFRLLRDLVKNSKKGDDYLSFSFREEHKDKEIITFISGFTCLRAEMGLNIYVLCHKNQKKTMEENYTKKMFSAIKIKYIDLNYPQGTVVLNDDVVILEWGAIPVAIKIHGKKISENYRKFFFELYGKKR